ncbi:four helix bundle protein [Candidatus Parcubacteria bacterium]|nr:MAG: four helix bundle protein [Candidatus Parcubacteria bacterium]
MRRCAISISSNIAEGAARNTKKEFVNFLYIARAHKKGLAPSRINMKTNPRATLKFFAGLRLTTNLTRHSQGSAWAQASMIGNPVSSVRCSIGCNANGDIQEEKISSNSNPLGNNSMSERLVATWISTQKNASRFIPYKTRRGQNNLRPSMPTISRVKKKAA